jgi:hypothetical protein
VAVAERVIFMGLVKKKTKEVFQIKGQVREYDNAHDALWHYVFDKINSFRRDNILNYEKDREKIVSQILEKQKICDEILEGLSEISALPPEEDIDEDEEWDDAEPASGKFAVGDEE